MRLGSGRRAPWIVASCVIALALAAAGAAYAGIPAQDGLIYACYKKTSPNQGALRVVDADAGQACGRNESPLSWQQASTPATPVQVEQNGRDDIILLFDLGRIRSVEISVPSDGKVFVQSWVTVTSLGGTPTAAVKLVNVNNDEESLVQAMTFSGAGQYVPASVGWVFDVSAGDHEFALYAGAAAGTINLGNPVVNALFIPD